MQQSQHLCTLKTTVEAGGAHSLKALGALHFDYQHILSDPPEGLK